MLISKKGQPHAYTYALKESLLLADDESTLLVQPKGKGGLEVTWSSSFNAADASDIDAEGASTKQA